MIACIIFSFLHEFLLLRISSFAMRLSICCHFLGLLCVNMILSYANTFEYHIGQICAECFRYSGKKHLKMQNEK